MGLLVRRAEPRDAPAVARVHTASWQQAYRGLLPEEYLDSLSVEARTTSWAKTFSRLPRQTPTNLVAELDGQIIGFACVGPSRDDDTDTAIGELWGSTWTPRTGEPDMVTPCIPKPWTSRADPGQPPQSCGF